MDTQLSVLYQIKLYQFYNTRFTLLSIALERESTSFTKEENRLMFSKKLCTKVNTTFVSFCGSASGYLLVEDIKNNNRYILIFWWQMSRQLLCYECYNLFIFNWKYDKNEFGLHHIDTLRHIIKPYFLVCNFLHSKLKLLYLFASVERIIA